MPDLDGAAVRAWLRENETAAFGMLDGDGFSAAEREDVQSALSRCGSALHVCLSAGTEPLARLLAGEPARSELRQIMAQLGPGWALRVIGWIAGERLPDSDAIVSGLSAADATGSGQFLRASFSEAARPVLLSRLFAPGRLADLLAACDHLSQEKEAA